MAAEQPGAEFLQRRLARAQAVPPAERSPEVQAFIACVELGRQICELLPLEELAGGQPAAALPLGDATTARRAACAVLKLAQVHYLSLGDLPFEADVFPHIQAYTGALELAAQSGGSFGPLASNLVSFWGLLRPKRTTFQRMQALRWGARFFDPAVQAAISPQLQQLSAEQPAGQLPFSLRQLLACLFDCTIHTYERFEPDPESQQSEIPADVQVGFDMAAAAMRSAADSWLQLEPYSHRAAIAKSFLVVYCKSASTRILPQMEDVARLLQASSRAQKHGSPFVAARCAAMAVHISQLAPLGPSLLRSVIDAFSHVEPGLRASKRMLPGSWVADLRGLIHTAKQVLPTLVQRLQLQTGNQGEGSSQPLNPFQAVGVALISSEMERTQAANLQHFDQQRSALECAGCGKKAVGLRNCARCRAVRYCSRACQVAHWPQHKRECRPA